MKEWRSYCVVFKNILKRIKILYLKHSGKTTYGMRNEEDNTSKATPNMQDVAPRQTNQLNTSSVLPVSLAGIKPPNNLNLKDNRKLLKVALFLYCWGEDALKVYNGLLFESEKDRQNLTKVIEKLDDYAIGEVNKRYERYVFNSRNQGPSESVEAYITEQRKLMKSCNFCDCLREIKSYWG